MPMISAKQTQAIAVISSKKAGDMSAGREEAAGVRGLLWGEHVKEDVFRRWSQGFRFSPLEPSALVQEDGGPCAAIAPVQAFLLRALLADAPLHGGLQDVTREKCASLLVRACCDILAQCDSRSFHLALLARPPMQASPPRQPPSPSEQGCSYGDPPPPVPEPLTSDTFHERLLVEEFPDIQEVERFYTINTHLLTDQYGVLLLLYSVILTKGVENVKGELSDLSDPLIHATYGYGSQGLINLMLTGRAVAHVWDHEQHIGGLRLSGIDRQPDVGFITIMEHMQYCTVGSFYKNPKNPVWVMGSETHLTVVFSFEKKLVSPETAAESAKRIFRSFDPDGNNFIQSVLLQDLLCAVDLVSDPEYVDIMRRKLDAENLGIILLNAFMDEFFSGQQRSTPDTFTLMHYNGLPRSNLGGEVKYRVGNAILLEGDLRASCEDPMLTCLQTKWPGLEVSWNDGKSPSLN